MKSRMGREEFHTGKLKKTIVFWLALIFLNQCLIHVQGKAYSCREYAKIVPTVI